MLRDLTRQVQDLSNNASRRELIIQIGGPRLNDLSHEVDRPGLGEHRKVRIEPDAHAMIRDDALRKGVVSEGRRVLVEALTQLGHLA